MTDGRRSRRRPAIRTPAAALAVLLTLGACGTADTIAAPATSTTTGATAARVNDTPAPPVTAPAPVEPPAPAAAPPPAVAPGIVSTPSPRPNIGGDRHPMAPPREIGRIEIPKIGLIHPTFEGIDLPQLHHGPGHWPGSAMPGQTGNVVFAGHRVTHTRPFLDIDRLAPGDRVIMTTAAGSFTYEVTGSEVVRPADTWIVNPTPDATMTLFACHPKRSAAKRYVVRGRLLPPV